MQNLQIRFSKDTGFITRGVAQGCPLSMICFCAVMNLIVKEVKIRTGIDMLVYADDQTLKVKRNTDIK